ncbi:MAG TPA: DMT family transporter [Gemmatimonadales bacterium]|jgi:drug/metabolite transporter (DMT)-like permease|nr:DMT family transporter [Gemmatimonadales bacterium]
MSPLFVLIVAVLATTYAGPVIRLATAPALAIAFWRLAMVLPVTAAGAARENRLTPGPWPGGSLNPRPGVGAAESRGSASAAESGMPLVLMAVSGLALAAHFWTWIASLKYTSVASSVVLVSLKPVFAWGIAALWLREHPTRREKWGIVLAVLGAVLIGIADARGAVGAIGGDVLALVGALAAAIYYVIGRRARATVGVWSYATVVYTVAAATLAGLAVGSGLPFTGYPRSDWIVFAALAAGPMLVGHTGLNYALKYFRATTVNVAALGEPVGAAILAWLIPAIHEVPTPLALLGGVVTLGGIGLALTSGGEEAGATA